MRAGSCKYNNSAYLCLIKSLTQQKQVMSLAITVTNPSKKVSFEVLLDHIITESGLLTLRVWAFGVLADTNENANSSSIHLPEWSFKTWSSKVNQLFGAKLKKGGVQISILPSDMEQIENWKAECRAESETVKAAWEARCEAAPKRYAAWDFLDWGDYNITQERAIVEFRQDFAEPTKWVQHKTIMTANDGDIADRSEAWAAIVAREKSGLGEQYRDMSAEEVAEWSAWHVARLESEAQKAAKQKAAKEAAQKLAAEKRQADRAEIEKNELFVFAANTIYSGSGNRMLHSIGAKVGSKIELYTTSYAADMKRAGVAHTTTFDAKDALKALGFKWDGEEKHWVADYSEETWGAVLPILKKYDTKVWPETLGMGRCWECGCYSKHLDADGYCGC